MIGFSTLLSVNEGLMTANFDGILPEMFSALFVYKN